jgi:hypothetical protein
LEKDLDENTYLDLVSKRLSDPDPHVKRAATELLVKFPQMTGLEKALLMRGNVPKDDSHQLYTTRLMLRNLLRNETLMKEVVAKEWNGQDAKYLVDVIVGVPSEDAAVFLARYIDNTDWEGHRLSRLYEHLVRYTPSSDLDRVVATVIGTRRDDVDFQYIVLNGVQQGMARRGAAETSAVRSWGTTLAEALLKKYVPGGKETPKEVLEKQRFAADLVGRYKIVALEPLLITFFNDSPDVDVKISALRSLLILNTNKHAALAGLILKGEESPQLKNRVASLLAEVTDATPEGKDIIFRKVKKGELLPRMLIQPNVEERILLNLSRQQEQEFRAITAKLDPISKERQTLIDTRLIAFSTVSGTVPLDSGKMIFSQNCAACHSIQHEGGNIGPQLDGVGKVGRPRACREDTRP